VAVLRRQVPRPRFEPADRALLAAFSRVLPRANWSCFQVKPETLLRWHRHLVAGVWTYPHRGRGRPPLDEHLQQLLVRLAAATPRWATKGSRVSCSGLGSRSRQPRSAKRYVVTAWTCPAAHEHDVAIVAASAGRWIIACDCFTVDTVWLKRLSVLLFIELDTRRVHLAGVTANPDGAWVAQQARNLLLELSEQGRRIQFLLRDRTPSFCRACDALFRSEGAQGSLTPVQAPNANAVAERWVATVRASAWTGY
jgi:hypothetical protein